MLKNVGWTYQPDEFHMMRKFEDFDTEYGQSGYPWNKPIRTPNANERWSRNGLTGESLFAELERPIYGNGNQKFGELLPVVTKVEPETLQVSSWRKYPDVIPDYPDGTLFNLRIEIAPHKHKVFPSAPYDSFWWSVFQPEYKEVDEPNYTTVDNPDYPEYLEMFNTWKEVVLQYLIPQGLYQYPGLPLIDGYQWYEDGVRIPRDQNHFLATETAMYKMIRKNMPPSAWNVRVNGLVGTCIMQPYPLNVRYICGI